MKVTPSGFYCEPKKFGCKARCCSDPWTRPNLTLPDLVRISEFESKKITQLWQEKGALLVQKIPVPLQNGKDYYVSFLSLLHDPCLYLNEEEKCALSSSKPLNCFSFPLIDNNDKVHSGFKDKFPCLLNYPTKNQKEWGNLVLHFINRVGKHDEETFYGNGFLKSLVIEIKSKSDLEALCLKAQNKLELKKSASPKLISLKKLVAEIYEGIKEVVQSSDIIGKGKDLSVVLSPLVSVVEAEKIIEHLEETEKDQKALGQYAKFNADWEALRSSLFKQLASF